MGNGQQIYTAVHIINRRVHVAAASEGVVDTGMIKTGNFIGFKVEHSKFLVYSVGTWLYYYMMQKW